jgi:hypothetical protein
MARSPYAEGSSSQACSMVTRDGSAVVPAFRLRIKPHVHPNSCRPQHACSPTSGKVPMYSKIARTWLTSGLLKSLAASTKGIQSSSSKTITPPGRKSMPLGTRKNRPQRSGLHLCRRGRSTDRGGAEGGRAYTNAHRNPCLLRKYGEDLHHAVGQH